jgi:hypothetical protein
MKKVLVTLLVVVASSTMFAVNNNDYDVFYKLNNQSTLKGLVRYLDASYTQADQLEYIFSITEDKLNSALNSKSTVSAEKAVLFNISNVKYILSDEQYKKYLVLLNLSRNNMNGFEIAEK